MQARAQTVTMLGLATVGLLASLALGYDVNKDLRNIGTQPAFDVAVILAGAENVTSHFDGYSNRHFSSFSNGPSGPNTMLHWQNLNEPGGNGQIDPGEIVHVGWSTSDHSSTVLNMYWTDQQGQAIPGSKIFNITSGWTYEVSGLLHAGWSNVFRTEQGERFPIQILNVSYVIVPTPWPLAELNAANTELNAQMRQLPDGTFVVSPDQTVELTLPELVPPGAAVVLRYGVMGPGDAADAMDWVQFVVTPPGLVGDMNCDGQVNFDDINPFVLALSDPAGYQRQFPNCDILHGDINGDGRVDFDDINPFVALLSGGPA